VLFKREGRVVPLATVGGVNLLKASAPTSESRQGLRTLLSKREKSGEPVWDERVKDLAVETIREDPLRFLKMGARRALLDAWRLDPLLLRHMGKAIYPPLPPLFLAGAVTVSLVAYLLLLVLAVWGFRLQLKPVSSFSNLLLLAIILSLGLAFFSGGKGGNTRITLVNLALMLPAAGYAVRNLPDLGKVFHKGRISTVVAIATSITLPLLIIENLPETFKGLRPTSYYAGLVEKLEGILGVRIRLQDQVVLRADPSRLGDHLSVELANSRIRFGKERSREMTWDISTKRPTDSFVVVSEGPSSKNDAPLEIFLQSRKTEQRVSLLPIRKSSWRKWTPSGIAGIDYMWTPVLGQKAGPDSP
jgi:hypothetical protein